MKFNKKNTGEYFRGTTYSSEYFRGTTDSGEYFRGTTDTVVNTLRVQ